MPESTAPLYGRDEAVAGRISTAQLLAQVSFLVAVALGFCALGTYIGRDLSPGTSTVLFVVGIAMLFASSFAGRRFRVGAFAIGWLYAIALLLGLGLGPTIRHFAEADQSALTSAAGATALTVLAMASLGFVLSKDLGPWMRPLSIICFATIVVSWVLVIFAAGTYPLVSAIIGLLSAALIAVDFNYLRKHGTEDDAVWLATGIFVSILNIFLSLLNIFSGR
jgi:FtsH-binding integral membrane protein